MNIGGLSLALSVSWYSVNEHVKYVTSAHSIIGTVYT